MTSTTIRPVTTALDLTPAELGVVLRDAGQPAYRSEQVVRWLYRGARSYDEMTDLPKALRAVLAERLPVTALTPVRTLRSQDGLTTKVLFRLVDGPLIEAVHMRHAGIKGRERSTICLSSQAGCAYGCTFCATGQGGFGRNLTPGEIVEQALYFLREHENPDAGGVVLPAGARPITNIVFMGMGEPFANYANVMTAVRALNAPWGLGLGARHITVSTVGLVPELRKFMLEPLQLGLAISLHAPNDDLRSRIMPVNRKYSLVQLIPACRDYAKQTGRRVTFEYVMLAGINDSVAHAQELAGLLRGMLCHVNLIPMNPTADSDLKRPDGQRLRAFQHVLEGSGVPATVRDTQGADIQAACGQLRTKFEDEGPSIP